MVGLVSKHSFYRPTLMVIFQYLDNITFTKQAFPFEFDKRYLEIHLSSQIADPLVIRRLIVNHFQKKKEKKKAVLHGGYEKSKGNGINGGDPLGEESVYAVVF